MVYMLRTVGPFKAGQPDYKPAKAQSFLAGTSGRAKT